MFELEGLDHIAIGVRDIQRSAAWYIDVLGFKRRFEGKWNGVPTFIGQGKTAIALFPRKEGPDSPRKSDRILHFALRANRENFIAAQASLRKRGIPFEFQDHEISHSIYFRDPDGYVVEITTYDIE